MHTSGLSPFLFILNQLEAAEVAKQKAAEPPPKRPRGRPPKVEVKEEPLPLGVTRHVLSDEDSEFDKQILREEEQEAPRPPPQVDVNGLLAIVIPTDGKFVCVYDGKVIGSSKHKDYWEYHWARGDLRSAQQYRISKFVRVTDAGAVESVSSAMTLRKDGVKHAFLPTADVTTAELEMISEALLVAGEPVQQP